MLFNSYIFIFVFFPITFALYFLLNRFGLFRVAEGALVVCSLVFYGYQNPCFALLLIGSILVNYALHLAFRKIRNASDKNIEKKLRIALLILGLVINFGILFYFKYYNFFLTNITSLFGISFNVQNIILPLGISFYTFQQVSFVADNYYDRCPDYSLLEYALFVSFFPQLIAGPIVLHSEMIPQFGDVTKKKINSENLFRGIQYFILGLSKKVLLADMLGRAVDYGYANVTMLNRVSALALILFYTLQIYFDFSGYCDMAMGLGRMFNLDIAVNFDSPYKASSVSEFWKRWHITLTRFFTTYLYIPLGGNRKGTVRTCLNVLIVFALSGLWHGADWTFVFWGLLHGVFMVIERLLKPWYRKISSGWSNGLTHAVRIIRKIYTFGFVSCAWVFFRADSFSDALIVFKRVLVGGNGLMFPDMRDELLLKRSEFIFTQIGFNPFESDILRSLLCGALIILVCIFTFAVPNSHEAVKNKKTNTGYCIFLGILCLLSIISLSSVSKFLYFNF